jgi:hypothetical protein
MELSRKRKAFHLALEAFFWPSAIVAGIVAAVFFLVAIVATGNTFGQRCKAMYKDKHAVQLCVTRLSQGRRP